LFWKQKILFKKKRREITSRINFLKSISLPSPSNLSFFWNFGSLLGACLVVQLITGLILSIRYFPDIESRFSGLVLISRNTDYGIFVRIFHGNGARFFFIFLYIHIARGIYFGSFLLSKVWIRGCTILLLSIITAFLGYVLPIGQISLWGRAVITGLLSAIPVIGERLVYWVWSGSSVNGETLNRFFRIHYILPFIIGFFTVLHLHFLHLRGSSNPLGLERRLEKIRFYNYFIWKDIVGFIVFFLFFFYIVFYQSYVLLDAQNFIKANRMVTPVHIQPEWYFLFAYAILRRIPRKSGGVLALALSVLIYYLLASRFFFHIKIKGVRFNPLGQVLFIWFIVIFFILTFLGACPAEGIYLKLGILYSKNYFIWFFLYFISLKFWGDEF